ncbi:TlpA disulfide reductase family protein [Sphingomonas sp. RT2P30]|uniref:TlpA family protein disulfide reductase n=1 Tax=Parasphingomonas halimpatiens TaxID=3096162 RepID=UPI002FC9388E
MRRFLPRGIRALALVIGAALSIGAGPPKVGTVAPPFELTLIDGSKVTLDQLRGQVVVLNFWATWCGPCKAELPLLDKYYDIQKDHGLKVYAIATEDSLPPYMLKKLFAMMHMPSAKRIKGNYPVLQGVPTNYVIDRSSHIRYAKAAAFDLDDLNREIVPLLNEPVPIPPAAG